LSKDYGAEHFKENVIGNVKKILPSLPLYRYHWPALPIVHHRFIIVTLPSLTVPHRPSPSFTVPHRPSPSFTVPHRPSPSLTVLHRPSPPRYRPSPSFTVPHRPAPSPSFTVPHRPSPSFTVPTVPPFLDVQHRLKPLFNSLSSFSMVYDHFLNFYHLVSRYYLIQVSLIKKLAHSF
jgi:hypothetical protein